VFVKRHVVKTKKKTYVYHYIVRSVRNEKGTPTHERIANISKLPPRTIENIRRALKAGGEGKAVVVEPEFAGLVQAEVRHSLDYLDVALVYELFKERGLDSLLDRLLTSNGHTVAPRDVVASLVIQRAVAPASKLAAARWYPRTALPEILDVPTGAFNNSRIHRTLDAIDKVGEQLQACLCHELVRQKPFVTLFMDSTDTFFIGSGPPKATRGKTKEGRTEHKVGVLLLCNERGEPLRWEVVEGNSADNMLFRAMFEQLQSVSWANQVPVVVDRAMGTTADIQVMYESGLRFLTALTATEFDSYTDKIPREQVGGLELTLGNAQAALKSDCAQLAQLVLDHGFEKVDDDLFVLDLGVREAAEKANPEANDDVPSIATLDESNQIQQALRIGEEIKSGIESGQFSNQVQAAQHYGRGRTWAGRRVALTRLPRSIRRDIEAGHADHVGLVKLVKLTRLTPEQQQVAYDELKRVSSATPNNKPRPHATPEQRSSSLPVRQVLYFRPSLHLQKRQTLNDKIARVRTAVRNLNADIDAARTYLSTERQIARVEQLMVKNNVRRAFEIESENGRIRLVENQSYLARLRGRYGFCYLVGHPDLTETGAELIELYRSKNEIEYDFRVIKSQLALRPIYHQTDEKVAAHITICMLALLLIRTLDQKLAQTSLSAGAALELFASNKLNHLLVGDEDFHTVTRPTKDQENLLKRLEMHHLVEDDTLSARISPR